MTTGNEAEELQTEELNESVVEEEAEASVEPTDEADQQVSDVEAWMQVDEEAATTQPEGEEVTKKPTQKQKLRARLETATGENDQLKARIAELEKQPTANVAGLSQRPKRDDYDTEEEYDEAYDSYRDQKDEARVSARGQQEISKQYLQSQAVKVDAHYDRGAKLVDEHGISPEAYQASDAAIRNAVETERPGHGEVIVNDLISRLGEGSEKTLFFIGRNKPLLNEFRTLLKDDPTGLDALVFVVKQGEKANGTKKTTSQAPAPAAQINGEGSVASGSKQKKAYDKEADPQKRYNMKKAAKAAKLDVSDWK